MRNEYQLSPAHVVEDAIVIWSPSRIAVPVDKQDFTCDEAEELVYIEQFIQPCPTFGGVRLCCGLGELCKLGAIPFFVSRVNLEPGINFSAAACIIKVSFGRGEVSLEELFVRSFQQDVETQRAPIQAYQGVARAGRWNPNVVEEIPRHGLAQVTGILHRIVQMDLAQTVKLLAGSKLVEIKS